MKCRCGVELAPSRDPGRHRCAKCGRVSENESAEAAPEKCFTCALDLKWDPGVRVWTCPKCLYCRRPSLRGEMDKAACVNLQCPARDVPWQRCGECRELRRLEIDPSGAIVCVTLACYNGFTIVECHACGEAYPVAVGACVHPGCGLAFRRAVPCFFCKRKTRGESSREGLNPACAAYGRRALACDRCREASVLEGSSEQGRAGCRNPRCVAAP